MKIFRIYVEKKPEFAQWAGQLHRDLVEQLEMPNLIGVRVLQRYDVTGIDGKTWTLARKLIFSDPPVDYTLSDLQVNPIEETAFAVEYLPGQFDQRADSAEQCLRILNPQSNPKVAHARIYILRGSLGSVNIQQVKRYLINPVDSHETTLDRLESMGQATPTPEATPVIEGFVTWSRERSLNYLRQSGLAMSLEDFEFCQRYFREEENRNPSETELRILDTYWSDHCRHTTFLTRLNTIDWGEIPPENPIRRTYDHYLDIRATLYGEGANERPVTLMDLATIGMKYLRKKGALDDLELSEEVNAASIEIPVSFEDGSHEEWLLMFKNETHNHPTEIEPFGGAATCLGGAIRDPLSGRAYVYQAMRVTGSGDPRTPFNQTLSGKLPQRVITKQAALGYSSYGNQIGIATGMVSEIYHPGYIAKRMEIGAVIAAAPRENVVRGTPAPGDVILLVGGKTGRDGVGGATGSSKQHTDSALENTAEVQKGNPPVERSLQRLFRNPEATELIKRCNDFGAGGISVAIGEIAPSLEIDLDRVPKKYEGLNGTDLAISESQERMAVCLSRGDAEPFVALAARENLDAVPVAEVTDTGRLVMKWNGKTIVDISRKFLDTHGVTRSADVRIREVSAGPLYTEAITKSDSLSLGEKWIAGLRDLNNCSRQGLIEHFDSTIGAGSILHPLGGKNQLTPAEAMAARIPSLRKTAHTCSLMSWGFDPYLATQSPFHGAVYAVVHAVSRLVAAGADYRKIRLTLQEYFERPGSDPTRWAKPFASLLGALTAQLELNIAAVGGKDSMSGSFNDLDVPPTLVAFAVATAEDKTILSPELKKVESRLFLLRCPRDSSGLPHWKALRDLYESAHKQLLEGTVYSMTPVGTGGIAAALSKSAFGNNIGFRFSDTIPGDVDLFEARYDSLLVEADDFSSSGLFEVIPLGSTMVEPVIQLGEMELAIEDLIREWRAPLESVFPTRAAAKPARTPAPLYTRESQQTPVVRTGDRVARPRVIIPTFPGINCEWDSARAFREAGAQTEIVLFRNRTREDIEDSLEVLTGAIDRAQILMLPGGFSAGDEPEGSGKFIATVFRNSMVADATMRLLRDRDGLALGICNGFQALIKLGLVPFGEIRNIDAGCPTLTFNLIGRHVSRYVHTRISSTLSPWLSLCRTGEIHTLPVSHGEGCFHAEDSLVRSLGDAGQIAAQYVDVGGIPQTTDEVNPNGSVHNIEAITSADGRILGKMAHSERTGPHVGKNIPGNKSQPLFQAGVRYFSG